MLFDYFFCVFNNTNRHLLLHSVSAVLIRNGEINKSFFDDSEEIGKKILLDSPSFTRFLYKTEQKLGAGHAENLRSSSQTTRCDVEAAPHANANIYVDILPMATYPVFLLWGPHGHEQQVRPAGIYLLDNSAGILEISIMPTDNPQVGIFLLQFRACGSVGLG